MSIQFSEHPGPRERHLKRRLHNPLFAEQRQQVSQADVDAARQRDETALMTFMQHFRSVVQQAVELPENAETEQVMQLRDELDGCYATCSAMQGHHPHITQAINQLMDAIMSAVRKGAADDMVALQKLDEEAIARRMHQQLQGYALIADLMLEDCPIEKDELTAVLLDASEKELDAALQLFDETQIRHVYQQAEVLLNQLREKGLEFPEAWQRFAQIRLTLQSIEEENGTDA